jgi:hypothetical protein
MTAITADQLLARLKQKSDESLEAWHSECRALLCDPACHIEYNSALFRAQVKAADAYLAAMRAMRDLRSGIAI